MASSGEVHIVARAFPRDAFVIANGAVVRTIHTAADPHAVRLAPPGCVSHHGDTVAAIAEGHLVRLCTPKRGRA